MKQIENSAYSVVLNRMSSLCLGVLLYKFLELKSHFDRILVDFKYI